MTLHLYLTYLETQMGPNYWYEQFFYVWCSLRKQNGGLNSGLKSATIVTDALVKYRFKNLFRKESLTQSSTVI